MISRSSRLLHAALVVACGAGIVYAPVQAQTALTLQLGQPGYYGQISIGNLAAPPVYDRRAVIVSPPQGRSRWTQASVQPVYLRVPQNQALDWRRYCGVYQACSVPVYFVRDDWYRNVYSPRVRAAATRDARDRWRSANQPAARMVVTPAGRDWRKAERRGWDRD